MAKHSFWLILVVLLLSACGGNAAATLPSAQQAETALADMPLPQSEETLLAQLLATEISYPTEIAVTTPTITMDAMQAPIYTDIALPEDIAPTLTPPLIPTLIPCSSRRHRHVAASCKHARLGSAAKAVLHHDGFLIGPGRNGQASAYQFGAPDFRTFEGGVPIGEYISRGGVKAAKPQTPVALRRSRARKNLHQSLATSRIVKLECQ